MPTTTVIQELTAYIEKEILKEEDAGIEPDTPLLEYGILDSISTARLVAFAESHFGITIAADKVLGRNFRDLRSIAALVTGIIEADQLAERG